MNSITPGRIVELITAITATDQTDEKRRLSGQVVTELHRSGLLGRLVRRARAKTDLSEDLEQDLLQDAAEHLLTKLATSTKVPEESRVINALFYLVLGAVGEVARSPARRDGRTGLTTTARRNAAWRSEWQRQMLALGREPSDAEVAAALNAASKEHFDGSNHLVPPQMPLDTANNMLAVSGPVEEIARDLAVIVARRIEDRKQSAEITASVTAWALAVSSNLIDPTSATDLAALRGITYYRAAKHLKIIEEAIVAYREVPG